VSEYRYNIKDPDKPLIFINRLYGNYINMTQFRAYRNYQHNKLF